MINITEKRIENLIRELYRQRYKENLELDTVYTADRERIPFGDIEKRPFKALKKGEKWGELWDSGWFRFSGKVPSSWKGKQVVALIDIGSEGCVFRDGSPYCGITYKRTDEFFERKRRVMLFTEAAGGETVDLLVEGAANGLFGMAPPWSTPWPYFQLNQAELAVFDSRVWQLAMDMEFLLQLYKTMNPDSPRAKKILRGLNETANLTPLADHIEDGLRITGGLIKTPVSPSTPTAWSVGHAHLDLAWLWRYKETRRKGGRTFSTALRLMEEYPEYIFGASQPQLFQWIKEDYPRLYEDVKKAVARGRMECQGGMWVEPDMNVTGGESLVRQCLYGKKFFRDEFGVDVNNLWLPDVFGYSAALPQILKKSGIDYFITQKISWNETNEFPHHTFLWKGIDGTAVEAHFLPANDYNSNNEPQKMNDATLRFAQSDIHDGYLNLFGVGDGGGGPSRRHIEWARRGNNCEGMTRIKPAKASDFLEYLDEKGTADLPVWSGELYLELHRGTLTTQSLMKKHNRLMETRLRDVELLGTVSRFLGGMSYPKEEMERIWKETLLNQFHDVLPGSSIREVYQDASEISERNLKNLKSMEVEMLEEIFPEKDEDGFTVINTQPWERTEILCIDGKDCRVTVPPMGFLSCSGDALLPAERDEELQINSDGSLLENSRIKVELDENGLISSLILKELDREMLSSDGAAAFKLYEDKPYFWDAWDISPYYRETQPETAVLESRNILEHTPVRVAVEQVFSIGNSRIRQNIELRGSESILRVDCRVDWKEDNKMLRLCSGTSITWPTATYEIQYGSLERPTHSNTSWDDAKFEVCGHKYVDLSQADRGLSLMNDSKYGYRIHENMMEMTLLRSPSYPDPGADRGVNEFSFAFMPHAGRCDSRIVKESHNFNSPLLVLKGRKAGSNEGSWFTVDNGNICIEAVKPAENGDGFVVRCYETQGGSCTCRLKSSIPAEEVCSVNLLEEIEGQILPEGDSVRLDFKPFEIKTLLFR